jgi:hypothetical protein
VKATRFVFGGLLALVVLACGATSDPAPPSPCARTYFVSGAFSTDEHAALARANDRWTAIDVAPYCLVAREAPEHTIRRIPYQGGEWQEISRSFGGANVLGLYRGADDSITIVDSLSTDLFELVAVHELGHAHGLAHVDAPAIMHATIGTATDFTPNDMAECRRVGACPDASQSEVQEPDDGIECALPAPDPSVIQAH